MKLTQSEFAILGRDLVDHTFEKGDWDMTPESTRYEHARIDIGKGLPTRKVNRALTLSEMIEAASNHGCWIEQHGPKFFFLTRNRTKATKGAVYARNHRGGWELARKSSKH
jgi:hypothetical protein